MEFTWTHGVIGRAEPNPVDYLVPEFTPTVAGGRRYNSSESDRSDQSDNDDDDEDSGEEDDDDDSDGERPTCELTAARDSTTTRKKSHRTTSVSCCIDYVIIKLIRLRRNLV